MTAPKFRFKAECAYRKKRKTGLTADVIIFLCIGAAAGGFINGLAGFGTSLFALGWWLQVITPVQAVAIALTLSVASGIQGVFLVRRAIILPRLARFVLPALAGVPIGLSILHRIDAGTLKVAVAVLLLVYGAFLIIRRNLPALENPTPVADMGLGFTGGILGAVAGLSGALPTMWLSMRPWPKEETRAVLQPYNVIVLGVSALLLAFDGGFSGNTLLLIALALPVTMIAAQIGIAVFKRLTDAQFRRLLILMLQLSGLILLFREIVA